MTRDRLIFGAALCWFAGTLAAFVFSCVWARHDAELHRPQAAWRCEQGAARTRLVFDAGRAIPAPFFVCDRWAQR